MSNVIQFPNSSASKVIQPKRKGRYPSKVTKLRTAWRKRYEKELANSNDWMRHWKDGDPFSEWAAACWLHCLTLDLSDFERANNAFQEYLKNNPPASQEWLMCLHSMILHERKPKP